MEHQSILPRNNKSNHETIEHLTKKKGYRFNYEIKSQGKVLI